MPRAFRQLLLALLGIPLGAAPGVTVEQAAIACDSQGMLAALRNGGKPNAEVSQAEGYPLHVVLMLCDTGIDGQQYSLVSHLLAYGAYVNAVNSFGAPVLEMAVSYGSAASIEAILRSGADPNQRSSVDVSLLTIAEMAGNTGAMNLPRQYGGVRGLSDKELKHLDIYPKMGSMARELCEWID